jgi:hypothetical protein
MAIKKSTTVNSRAIQRTAVSFLINKSIAAPISGTNVTSDNIG